MSEKVKCLIIGSGPAGYTAAIYAGRANLNPVLYEGMLSGGQLTTTTEIENFPGYPEGVDGNQMMMDLRAQAERFGADIRFGIVTAVDFSGKPHKVTIDGETTIEADTVIIATGASAKYLGLPDEHKYQGRGVSACATCDGFFYRKKTVAVVGGGDTALTDAVYLSKLCSKVYLVHRRNEFRAQKVLQDRVRACGNIEIVTPHTVKQINGDGSKVTSVTLDDGTALICDGIFIFTGIIPSRGIVKDLVELDRQGFIITDAKMETSLPGIFACGDIRTTPFRQVVTAAGDGAIAAHGADEYISSH